MVVTCSVKNCAKTKNKDGVSLYRFPYPNLSSRLSESLKELQWKRCQAWILALRRPDITQEKCEHRRVCSNHFISGKPAEIDDLSNPDWVPTLNLGYIANSTNRSPPKLGNKRKREPKPPMIINVTPGCSKYGETSDAREDDSQVISKIQKTSENHLNSSGMKLQQKNSSEKSKDKILFFDIEYLNKSTKEVTKARAAFNLTESVEESVENDKDNSSKEPSEPRLHAPIIQKIVRQTASMSTQSTQTDLTWEALEKLERELVQLLKQMEKNNSPTV